MNIPENVWVYHLNALCTNLCLIYYCGISLLKVHIHTYSILYIYIYIDSEFMNLLIQK